MSKRIKLIKILQKLDPREAVDFSVLDDEIKVLKDKLTEKVYIKTTEDVAVQLERFKKKMNLAPLLSSMEKLRESFNKRSQELFDEIEAKTEELSQADKERVEGLRTELGDLQKQLSSLEEVRKTDLQKVFDAIPNLADFEDVVNEMFLDISSRIDSLEEVEDWQEKLDALRLEILGKLAGIGGGNMNRNIAVGGNTSMLSKYTDINFKAGSNVTINYANNNTTKFMDITVKSLSIVSLFWVLTKTLLVPTFLIVYKLVSPTAVGRVIWMPPLAR